MKKKKYFIVRTKKGEDMGRHDKPHKRFEMRFEANILSRLDEFVDDVKDDIGHYKTNRTEVTEILIAQCLRNYDESLEYVRSQIVQIRQGR